jgi:alkylation response protein AidB-like acyl-CoA dehydrogenase
MRLGWNPHQERRREHFRRFAATAIAPGSATRDREGTFDRQIWKELAADNFWTGHIPRRYGGEGGDMWDFLAGFEGLALGADDCGFVLSAVAHAGLIQVLLDHGTPDQRGDLLPGLMNGQIGATAATEPAGGSHVAAIATSAVATGDGYLLSGHKSHITNAPVADTILIVGRVPGLGKRDITLFIVDAADAGVTTGQPEDLLGQRTSPTGSISLDHVTVPADRVIGAVGDGLTTLYSFLAFDRLMYGIVAATPLEVMIAHAMHRVRTRWAFGVPIGEHQLIQDKLVDMKVTMESSRWLAYSTAAALIDHDPGFSVRASCTKLTASEGLVRAATELIQIFGHAGYDRAGVIERYLRDAVAVRIAGGTTEMQKKNVFKSLRDSAPLAVPAGPAVPAADPA